MVIRVPRIVDEFRLFCLFEFLVLKSISDRAIASSEVFIVSSNWLPGGDSGRISAYVL